MKKTVTTFLVVDLETTGLDPQMDKIVEIAWQLVTSKMTLMGRGINHVIPYPVGDTIERIKDNPFVLDMHTRTGLLALLEDPNHPKPRLSVIEDRILSELSGITDHLTNFMAKDFPELEITHQFVLIGKNVHFDKSFIDRYMPRLSRKLSYRTFDETSLNFLLDALDIRLTTVGTTEGTGPKLVEHRAGYDAMQTYTRMTAIVDTLKQLIETSSHRMDEDGLLLNQGEDGRLQIMDEAELAAELDRVLDNE